jgi:hypothetical protein
MDIRQALLAVHSKAQAVRIVDHIGGDPQKFAELMSIFFGSEYRLTQRAAWPTSHCVERWPELIGPYLDQMIEQLARDDVHDAVEWNVARLLQYIDIPPKLQGKVYSYCVDLVDDINEPVAVREFSLTVVTKIATANPDLKNELRLMVEKHLEHTSGAFHKRARAIL